MNLIPTLSSDEAEQALTASTKAAVQAGVAVTIAIVDAAGAMLALRRMDGAKAYTIDLASRKRPPRHRLVLVRSFSTPCTRAARHRPR